MTTTIAPQSPIVAILLGASEFRADDQFNSNGTLNKLSLARSKERFIRYLRDPGGLSLKEDDIINYFDKNDSESLILKDIKNFVNPKGRSVTDILVCYIGHGASAGDDKRYVLYIKDTDLKSPETSALEIYKLATEILNSNKTANIHFLIDACFSGSSAGEVFCNPATRSLLEGRIEFLCSSEATQTSQAPDDEECTIFTGAVLDVLLKGIEEEPKEKLSLELVGRKARELIESRFLGKYPKPIYFPQPTAVDVKPAAIIGMPIFTNLAFSMQCCAVLSQSARLDGYEDHPMSIICEEIVSNRYKIKNKSGSAKILHNQTHYLTATDFVSSVEKFCDAVRKVCRSEIAIFDLTDYEPAIMLMLGIRSVICRGLTICVTFNSSKEIDPTQVEGTKLVSQDESPFYFKDIKLVNIFQDDLISGKGKGKENIIKLLIEGLKQLRENPFQFVDMPSFDPIRQLWPKDEDKKTLPYHENCLVLCSFSEDSQALWPTIKADITKAIIDKGDYDPLVTRSLDIDSPRLVSLVLFDAIRRYEFCVVDLTEWRANVLFELGVRLAATNYEPICILRNSSKDYILDSKFEDQLNGLKSFLDIIDYYLSATDDPKELIKSQTKRFQQCNKMVEDHQDNIKYRAEDYSALPWEQDGKLKPGTIYKIVWQFVNEQHEPVTSSVNNYLEEISKLYQVDSTKGLSPFIYPKYHPLSQTANKFGLESLIASLLYLQYRCEEELINDNQLMKKYLELVKTVQSKLAKEDETSKSLVFERESDQIFFDKIIKFRNLLNDKEASK
jgi:hypothetical protein